MVEKIHDRGRIVSGDLAPESMDAWKRCGILLKEYLFDREGFLMLDGDGVLFRSDSLEKPQLTTPDILDVHKRLERIGGRLGLVTARSSHTVHYLRSEGFHLHGPLIYEGGHVVIANGQRIVLASEAYREFVYHLREQLQAEEYFKDTWDEVQQNPRSISGEISICLGDPQWNGDYRASFWYVWRSKKGMFLDADSMVMRTVVPRIVDIASAKGLTMDDFDIRLSRMDNGLGIVRIAAKIGGRVVSKEMAAEYIWNGSDVVFVGDGAGDSGFEDDIQKRKKGIVIALGGSHDKTDEVSAFIQKADVHLSGPQEYVKALKFAMGIRNKHR